MAEPEGSDARMRATTMNQTVKWLLVPIGLLSWLVAGCGGQQYPLAPVAGHVQLNGSPLAGALVGFEPVRQGERLDAGPGSYGTTDAAGHYTLRSLDGDEGAVVGQHRVWIRTFRAKEGPNGEVIMVAPERVPSRYNSQTELTFEVKEGGTEEAIFDLSAP